MPITSPASLTKIVSEFGGPGNLAAYVRGGSYVPNISAFNAISATTSGLAISQFLNISALNATLPQYNAQLGYDVYLMTSGNPAGSNNPWAACSLILRSDGSGTYRESNVNTGDTDYNFTWLLSGSASNYYGYLDTPSIDAPTSSTPVASSVQLNTTREWQWYIETPYPSGNYVSTTATGNLRIKNSSGTDLAVISYSIFASATNGFIEP